MGEGVGGEGGEGGEEGELGWWEGRGQGGGWMVVMYFRSLGSF